MNKIKNLKVGIIIIALALVMLSVITLSSCGDEKKSTVDEIKEAGKLLVYTNAEFPPYEFMENNKIVGVDVKISEEIAKELGVELEMKSIPYDGLLASISSGKSDFGIAAFTVTDERKEEVDFSDIYDTGVQYLIIPEDSSVKTIEDLKDTKLGCQAGTTGQFTIEDEIGDEGVLKGSKTECKSYTSPTVALEDLKKGVLGAVVVDKAVAENLAKLNKGYKAIKYSYKDGSSAAEDYAIAFCKSKDNTELIAIANKVIKKLLKEDKIKKWLIEYSG